MDRLYLIRKARKASVNQPATQKYSIPIPTTVPHLPPTKTNIGNYYSNISEFEESLIIN